MITNTEINEFKHIFFRWLKDNNCYLAYNKEMKNLNKTVDDVICKIIKPYHGKDSYITLLSRIITYSFTWANTKQGDTYWLRLYNSFMHYYIENYNKNEKIIKSTLK